MQADSISVPLYMPSLSTPATACLVLCLWGHQPATETAAVLACNCNSIVTFPGPRGVEDATAAFTILNGQPCTALGGRVLRCKYVKWVQPGDEAADGDDGLPQVSNSSSSRRPAQPTLQHLSCL